MLLKLSVRSAAREFQIVAAVWQNAQLPKQIWLRHREADNGHWSGDDVMSFGTEVGRIGRWVDM